MPKYNILYLHNKSEISGGEQSLLGLWENLDRGSFFPLLVVPSAGDFSREAAQLGVKVIVCPFPQLRPWNIFAIGRTLGFLRRIMLQERIHLVHSHTARNNILASIIGRWMNVPVIWHERNILMKGEADITKMFLFLPHAVICNSQAVARRFGELPVKVKVILNGVDLDKFSPMAANTELKKKYGCEHKRIAGIVTNLTSRRRVEYFIEAAALIKAQEPDVSFFVVGGEFEEASKGRLKELKAKALKLGLQGSLFFMGRQDDVRPWMAIFDLSCHVTSQDACSRSVLEAMGMNCAIVAMNDGGNPELIENDQSGILVAPFDQNAFVNAVLSLLRDDEKRTALGKAARLRAQQYFDVKHNAQETQELYFQLIRMSPPNVLIGGPIQN